MAADLVTTTFWIDLTNSLVNLDAQYLIDTGYRLLAPTSDRGYEPLTKPYDSLVLKTYRRNILENSNWPDAPETGWITPDNWLLRVKDVIRTSVVVKYLDGVELVSSLIEQTAKSLELPCEISPEARDEGYYAYHVTITIPLNIPGETWEVETIEVPIEIQVTTQVQDLIRVLTHAFYEQRRRKVPSPQKWQWNYRSPEFVPNYLGHILHYVEGMIMEVRDRAEEDAHK